MTTAAVLTPVDEMSDREVLAAAAESQRAENAEAARKLLLAATWADLHPSPDPVYSAVFLVTGSDMGEPIAGPGCPDVAEFSIPEFGAVVGRSSESAKRLIGHALELRHRLPRLWGLVQAGGLEAWRACRIAEATIHASPALTSEAVGFVDAQAAAVAGRLGPVQTDRLVEEAITRFRLAGDDPTRDPEDGWTHVDSRHVFIDHDGVGFDGTVHVDAVLGIADAHDLDHALQQGAAALRQLGSEESLDARRATALGELARHQTALDLTAQGSRKVGEGDADLADVREASARELVLHVHLAAAAVENGQISLDPLGRLEKRQRLLLLDQVRSWCGDTHTRVNVKPVIDLNQDVQACGYAVPDRIRDHVILRDRTCVFPWCGRHARRCDIDHVIPFDHDAEQEGREQPGPTATWNLAPLCRRHHRLKTHGRGPTRWRMVMPEPGVVEWTSPHGHRFRRDHDGTTHLCCTSETTSVGATVPRAAPPQPDPLPRP